MKGRGVSSRLVVPGAGTWNSHRGSLRHTRGAALLLRTGWPRRFPVSVSASPQVSRRQDGTTVTVRLWPSRPITVNCVACPGRIVENSVPPRFEVMRAPLM